MLAIRTRELSDKNLEEARSFQLLMESAITQFTDFDSDVELKLLMGQYSTIVHLHEKYQSLFCSVQKEIQPIVTIADILVISPKLKHRYYSISSSSLMSLSELSVTVGTVNIKNAMNAPIRGLPGRYIYSCKDCEKLISCPSSCILSSDYD